MDIAEQRLFLERLEALDQKYRMEIVHSGMQNPDDPRYQEIVAEGMRQDQENQDNLAVFIKEYGWPRLTVHGVKACQAAFLVVQHSAPEYLARYFPMIKSCADVGEADPVLAAMVEDRLCMHRKIPQIYGSQAWRHQPYDPVNYYIWPIYDPATVNLRRQGAGFKQTVEEYATEIGAIYSPDLSVDVLLSLG